MLQLFDNKYPYTDFHELNLDWIISKMIQLDHKLTNFVSLNTIKYADPIAWNIASQYGTNTVVIDPATGIAYISTKPVPAGAAISDTNYWTVIFDLSPLVLSYAGLRDQISINYEQTYTSTHNYIEGDLIFIHDISENKDLLYMATSNININAGLVPDYNIVKITIEDIIGNLSTLTTSDKTSVVNAINEIDGDVGDLSNLTTSDKTSVVNAVNENVTNIQNLATKYDNLHIINVLDYGAVGDGVTDDTQAFKDAIADVKPHGSLFIPYTGHEYMITDTLDINVPMYIYSDYTGWDVVAHSADMTLDESKTALINFDVAGACFYSHMSGVTFRNITIKCSVNVVFGFRCDALNDLAETECRFIYFDNCTAVNLNNAGIGFSYEAGILGLFTRCVSYGFIRGFSVTGHNNGNEVSTSVTFINCWAENCNVVGFFFKSAYYCTLLNCASDSNAAGLTIGYDFLNCRNCSIIACGSERNQYGVRFTNSYDMLVNMVIACTSHMQYPVRIDTGGTLTFIACSILWWSTVTDPLAKKVVSTPSARLTFIGCTGFDYVYNGSSDVTLPNAGELDSQYTLGNFTL